MSVAPHEIQGTKAWHDYRATRGNASEAGALNGCSPHFPRTPYQLWLVKTGRKEVTENPVMARGARLEDPARLFMEDRLGMVFEPAVLSAGRLSASLDGITLDGANALEIKVPYYGRDSDTWQHVEQNGKPPEHYWWQCQQQLLCSGAERVVFAVCEADADENIIDAITTEVLPDHQAHQALRQAWESFFKHLDSDTPPAMTEDESMADARKNAATPETLPALRIEITGAVQASNLDEYRDHALSVFEGITTDLQTDQDFADAEKTVKWCKDVEQRLDAAKEHALSQTADIDALFRTIDDIRSQARGKRLELDRAVKARKDAIKQEIRQSAVDAIREHYAQINEGLDVDLGVPADAGQAVADAMKGKKTLKSLRDAADQAVADAKLAANEQAEKVRRNCQRLDEIAGDDYAALFADRADLVLKATEDMEATAKARIADHQAAEEKRLAAERERIRQEEQRKAEAEARRQQEAARDTQVDGMGQDAERDSGPIPRNTDELMQAHSPARGEPGYHYPAEEPANLKIGDIGNRLGFPLRADFIEKTLGVAPAGRDKRAALYRESDFARICRALQVHIEQVIGRRNAA